jgi:hypothetical protein
MKQNSWTRAAIGVFVLIILTVLILNSHQAQATFTATGTSLTGDSNSTIDVTGTLGIGNTNTTSIILGQLGQSVTLPGNLILPGITGLTQCLQVNSSGQVSGTGSVCGSGSTSPAGSNTQIQFNNSNAFGASANLTWVSPALTIGNAGSTTGQLALAGATSGSTILQPAAAASGILTLPAATGSIPYYTGSPTSGNCVSWGSSGALSDTGSACGAGGITVPGAQYDLLYSSGSGTLAVDTGRATYNASTGVLAVPGLALTGTTPAATSWVAGTGNIPTLPANSAGWAAPATGGTSYLMKFANTAPSVPSFMVAASAGTGDNVNESALSFVATSRYAPTPTPVTNKGFWGPTVEPPQVGVTATGSATGHAIIQAFFLPNSFTITHYTAYVATGAAAATCDVALYNSAGNLMANTGGFACATSATVVNGTISQTSVTLPSGWYYQAHCQSSTSVVLSGAQTTSGYAAFLAISNALAVQTGYGATAPVAGVCQSTLGSLTAVGFVPATAYWSY